LITGAGGFVGQRLARLLAQRGQAVLALVHRAPEGAAAGRLAHERIEVRAMDLEQPRFDALPKGIDAVVALAQSPYHRDFPQRAREIFAVNVAAQLALLEWARGAGVRRFVQASSGGVYGPAARIGVKEADPLGPDSQLGFYLASKLSAETLLQSYRAHFTTAAILRPFFIYGPGQRADMLMPRLIESVREEKPIRLQGPDGLRINPVYVDDAAEGFAAALALEGFHVLNLGGPEILSLRAIGEQIAALAGRPARFEAAPGRPSDYAGDTALASALLGAAKTRFAEGIARTLQGQAEALAR
jgi:UDP-glucose 4-epimerase